MSCQCRGTGYYYEGGFPSRCEGEGDGGRLSPVGGPATVAQWEALIAASATVFTHVRKIGPGRFSREEFSSEQEARGAAPGDGRSMIYAVTPEGRSVMIGNV
jgi:hypothetical protein